MKKKHHFRPAAHLRLFADSTGRLWITDKSSGKQFQQIPDNIGYEKFLYAPGDGPNPRADSVEEWLANVVDGPGSNALRKAAQQLPLDNAERSALARFTAAQDFRTPVARDLLVPIFQRSLDRQWDAWKREPTALVDAIVADSGYQYSTDEILEHLNTYMLEVNKGSWLDFIQEEVGRVGRTLFNLAWTVRTTSEDGQFLTNDLGIVKADPNGNPVSWRLGFVERRQVWIFPVAPTVALLIGGGGEWVTTATKPWVDAVNEQMREDARRFVYSRDQP